MKSLYLLIDFFTILVPLLFSFHPKIKFYKSWKSFFLSNILVTAVFVTWDILFTKEGVWNFNPDYITGIYLFNLPIEEVFFFICIPFSCVFTFYCLNKFYDLKWNAKFENVFIIIFSLLLIVFGLLFLDRIYTSSTFISTGILCLLLKFVCKAKWIGSLFSVYLVLMIPFLIVNGMLTGTGLKAPVVAYNSSEIIGIRVLTIPVEDFFYGFELILLNIFFYKLFIKRLRSEKSV